MTFLWNIENLEVKYQFNELSNVITRIFWRLICKEDMVEVDTIGYVDLIEPNPNEFIEFEILTKEKVENWLENALGSEQINELKQNLSEKVQNKKMPVIGVKTPPWLLKSKE